MCKFDGDRAICLGEEAICAKVYRRTDGQKHVHVGVQNIYLPAITSWAAEA